MNEAGLHAENVSEAGATGTELEQENARLRGDLLTVSRRISHDLRAPLGSISITGEMIQGILEERGFADPAIVAPIFEGTTRLAKLIERVSFLLKASATPSPPTLVKMDLVIFNSRQRVESWVLKSGTQMTEPAAWPEVMGVAAWLEMIWLNLLANALQTEKDGLQIELGWRKDETEFRFWISDNGGGIPPEKIANLFQPFHLLHELNARHGLGLSIVQRLVELQSGNCGYEPSETGGARFYFTLPHGAGK